MILTESTEEATIIGIDRSYNEYYFRFGINMYTRYVYDIYRIYQLDDGSIGNIVKIVNSRGCSECFFMSGFLKVGKI